MTSIAPLADRLRRQWEALGEQDPLWAILSDPAKKDNRWGVDEFLETGFGDVSWLFDQFDEVPFDLHAERALDFGCGVGRLTRPLSDHFARVDGVDISAAMIDGARRLHADHPELVFHHVPGGRLPFRDRTFDLAFSRLVLQHMPTPIAIAAIGELVRVTRTDGLVAFQITTAWTVPADDPRRRPVEVEPPAGTAWMEMFAHPRADVEAAITGAGGRILETRIDDCAGELFESHLFLATRW